MTISPACSIVIPVYGTASALPILVQRCDTAFGNLGMPLPEFIFVDDNGPGDAWSVIQRLCVERPETRGVQLMRNFGQHNATMCGFAEATGDVVVTLDDDLQHPPECIPLLIKALGDRQADLVYGEYELKQHAFGRNLGSAVVNWFYRTVFHLPVTITSFRAIRRPLVEAILRYDLNFTFIDGLLAWNTQRIAMVSVPHHQRTAGRSGYTLSKLVVLAMNMFTNFSLIPLQLVSACGIFASAVGMLLGLYYLILALFSKIFVPGYASIIVAVLVMGGLQLFSLGIIGEYIGRLHLNVNRKPQYTIRSRCGEIQNR